MPQYIIGTLQDALNAIETSEIRAFPFEGQESADQFAHWLIARKGAIDVNTAGLAALLEEFLDCRFSDVELAEMASEAAHYASTMDRHKSGVRALSVAMGAVESAWGRDVAWQIGHLATHPNAADLIRTHDLEPGIAEAVESLDVACSGFGPLFASDYEPGASPILDWLARENIWRLDTTMRSERDWDGTKDYDVVEVLALVRFVRDPRLRSLLIERSMKKVTELSTKSGPALNQGRRSIGV